MENKKIKIDLGFAVLVAEPSCGGEYKEICIGLETHDGVWFQDIARVGNVVNKNYRKLEGSMQEFGKIAAYIYSDACSEDYTEKFIVPLFTEPCNATCKKPDCIFHCCNNRCNLPATIYVDNLKNEVTECGNYTTKQKDAPNELKDYIVNESNIVNEVCSKCGKKFSTNQVYRNDITTYVRCPSCCGSTPVEMPDDFCGLYVGE